MAAGVLSTAPADSSEQLGAVSMSDVAARRPVVILLHSAKGANRSVAIMLALLSVMQLYPTWTLSHSHAHLLASRHYQTCPFVDNRNELSLRHFERQRFGENSMSDKDFLTTFYPPHEIAARFAKQTLTR